MLSFRILGSFFNYARQTDSFQILISLQYIISGGRYKKAFWNQHTGSIVHKGYGVFDTLNLTSNYIHSAILSFDENIQHIAPIDEDTFANYYYPIRLWESKEITNKTLAIQISIMLYFISL